MKRFVADENCDANLVAAMRASGYDVVSIVETKPGAKDPEVYAMAIAENRVLLSQDQDFSRLSARSSMFPPGIIMMRWGRFPKERRSQRLLAVLAEHGDRISGHIVVVEPSYERFRTLRPQESGSR